MRVVFMGTPPFAVPTLDAIVAAGHEVLAVVAQPDRPKGRGNKLHTPATVERARQLGIETRQPKAINQGPFLEWFTTADIDVAVVVAYGRILKPHHLRAPKRGCINLHGSLLPAYRGAGPIQWALVRGERQTGVCSMVMDEGLDTGDVLIRRAFDVDPDETAGELGERMAAIGAEVMTQTLARLDELAPVPQQGVPSLAPLITVDDARIDWTLPARRVHDLVRGMNPAPGAWATRDGERVKIWRTRVVEGTGAPGTVLGGPVVACGSGAVELLEAQAPGRKRQPGADFVNGARLTAGEVLS